jgi:hypothetical protein
MAGQFLMADRQLREQGLAFQQRIAAIESKLRALGLRAWPGAVRSEKSVDTFVPSDLAANQVVCTITVPGGRWLVHAQGTIGTVAVDAASAQYIMTMYAWDPVTGDVLPDNTFDLPTAYLYLPENPNGNNQYTTFSVMSDVIADDPVILGMAVQGTAGRYYNVIKPRIRCLPV